MKYVCSERELCLVEHRIKDLCKLDVHTGDNGTYTVRSLYFDDYKDSCYYDNENGVVKREKFRIRMYNADTRYIMLECKQKYKDKNHKFSCRITEEQCRQIMQGGLVLPPDAPEVLRKFYLQYQTRHLRPKVIVQYERTAYVYPVGNVRITFDRYVSGTDKVEDFLNPNLSVRPVMPKDFHVLEVKYDELIPDFIKNTMEMGNLRHSAYSKYCTCRRFCCQKEILA